ncbi:hypothetical protein [Paenibacillus polysaccharolyticus]|uniref:hypothetical protein n=1 Tax=Paenibacillus polysaccharolyticus TaxID=582692 RepID=UPI00280AD31D|nr:hypothetical protein [Paenibacillus polysaccharolyticus]
MEKSVEGALDAPGWIGIGRWLSPDFWFSPFQGGNPGINALASLLLPIPSLRWLASLLFQTKCKNLAGVRRGIKAGSLVVDEKSMERHWTLRDGSVSGAGYPRISRFFLFKEEIP